MPNIEDQQEQTVLEAWRCLHEAATTGQMTLQNGRVVDAESPVFGVMIQFFRQMSSLKPPKQKTVNLPDGYRPAVTRMSPPVEAPKQE